MIFTGSTEVAQLINKTLAERSVRRKHATFALIAETGGQNALIVDSSALPEQVVQDVMTSAFDSAGQRCSALRVLFLQEEIADKTIKMLKGAMQELRVGVAGPPVDRHRPGDRRRSAATTCWRTSSACKRHAKGHFSLELPAGLPRTAPSCRRPCWKSARCRN